MPFILTFGLPPALGGAYVTSRLPCVDRRIDASEHGMRVLGGDRSRYSGYASTVTDNFMIDHLAQSKSQNAGMALVLNAGEERLLPQNCKVVRQIVNYW